MMRAAEEEEGDGLVEAVLQSQRRSEQKHTRRDHALGSQLIFRIILARGIKVILHGLLFGSLYV